jgi:hypothetical protein
MTPKQIAAELRAVGHQDLNVTLNTLADQIPKACFDNGARVLDASDFSHWLREVAEAWRNPHGAAPQQILGQFPARDYVCPDCGHEHEDKTECKKYLGEGRFCPCETRVTA